MKSKYLLPIFALLLLFTACNDDNTPDQKLQDAQVSINTVLESASTKSYDRGTAPAYIAGVFIEAINNDYNWPVEKTYDFVTWTDGDGDGEHDGGGDDVTMAVKAGSNTFNATSIAAVAPFTLIKEDLDRASDDELQERVEAYAETLKTEHPIFVTYTANEVTKDIIFGQDNEVDLTFIADQGRINLVFDTEVELDFSMTAKLYDANLDLVDTQIAYLTDEEKACAIIFNRADMTADFFIDVTIAKNAANFLTSNEQIVHQEYIDVAVGENYTHLFNFNGSETTSTGFGITFEPVNDSHDSTQIDD